MSFLTLQQEKSWKAGTFLGLIRKVRFQGKPPPWIWREKWLQILKVKISLPEQKLPEPESGRNSRIIMLINGWGCVWTNRRDGLPWGLLSWEQGADVLWFYLQKPHQVVKCQEKNHFMSQHVDKESNHFEICPEFSPLHRTDYSPVKKTFQSLISSWERALNKNYWNIFDLKCVSFCYAAKWISYTYTYILSFLDSWGKSIFLSPAPLAFLYHLRGKG